jgi:hypothetical protein
VGGPTVETAFSVGRGGRDVLVQLTQCPYDGTRIEAEVVAGGSLLLSCVCCGATWEWHGGWVRRIEEPDREAIRDARTDAERTTNPAT